MRIYIDRDCKCHTDNPDGSLRQFDVEFFDGKCQTFIEGYRYCPSGEIYTREDGKIFHGECCVPWKDYEQLDAAQRQYERKQLADMENALAILLGGDVT